MFRLILTVICLYIASFEILLFLRFKKLLHLQKKSRARLWLAVYIAVVVVTKVPMLGYALGGRAFHMPAVDGWFWPLYASMMSWQYSLFVLFPLYLVSLLFVIILRAVLKKSRENIEAGNNRRRILLRGVEIAVNSLPIVASISVVSGIFLGSNEVVVKRLSLKIPGLHPDLQGLRIVQVSDIHIGHIIHDRYLGFCSGLVKELNADLLVATGDIIDNNNYYLDVAGRFFNGLHTGFSLGAIGILGNHDHIDNGPEAARGLSRAGLQMLINQKTVISRGKGRLQLVGLDYPKLWGPGQRSKRPSSSDERNKMRMLVSKSYFEALEKELNPELPLVVLNHHPSDFSYLKKKNIDLVLSGHTHGGQVRFSGDRNSSLNIAANVYEYYTGHYYENKTHLYVNDGLGHWMPLRINCPPEITLLELV